MRKFSGMKTKIKDRVIRNLAAIAAVAALFFLQGCGKEEVYFSVQDAALLGNVYLYQEIAENGTKKGSPYAVGLEQEGDGVCFTVSIRKTGFYDLDFSASGIGSGKYNIVRVDGAEEGLLYTPESKGFQECVLQKIYLEKGTHQIELLANWGWIRLEGLTLRRTKKTQDLVYQVSGALSDPDAGDSAKELMAYLTSIYGKQVLSGGEDRNRDAADPRSYGKAAGNSGNGYDELLECCAGRGRAVGCHRTGSLLLGAGRNSGVVVALVCPGEIPTRTGVVGIAA